VPTRGLLGYRNEFFTDTHGTGVINAAFYKYMPDPGNWPKKGNGSLVATQTGTTNLYGMINVQDRGELFIEPGVEVYEGQVVGVNARNNDIWVNVCKAKQLSNMPLETNGRTPSISTPRER